VRTESFDLCPSVAQNEFSASCLTRNPGCSIVNIGRQARLERSQACSIVMLRELTPEAFKGHQGLEAGLRRSGSNQRKLDSKEPPKWDYTGTWIS
jgi:hypothetical protein